MFALLDWQFIEKYTLKVNTSEATDMYTHVLLGFGQLILDIRGCL